MLEYVASGTTHMNYMVEICDKERIYGLINDCVGYLQGVNNHNYSFLFNAYAEKRGAKVMDKYFTNLHNIHSDSGGLQIVTQGKTITEEMKREIYHYQNTYSNVAMSFDEIPVSFHGETGGRMTANESRYFDESILEKQARLSGQNLTNQIACFLEEDIKAKPMLIIHGNSLETKQLWVNYMLEEIPEEYQQFIHGIATSGVALGTGQLEDIIRASTIPLIDIPDNMKKNAHMLGIGSMSRIVPIIMYKRSGFIPNDVHISYDSSSHTMGASMFTFYEKSTNIRKGLFRNLKIRKEFIQDCVDVFGDLMIKYDITPDELDYTFSHTYRHHKESGVESYNKFVMACILLVMTNIYNFTYNVDRYINGDEMDVNNVYRVLEQIKNKDDFEYLISHIKRYSKSKAIPVKDNSVSLEQFFT